MAKRILESLCDLDPQSALTSIEKRLRGIELDPFAAWMSQIFLDATLFDVCSDAGRLPKPAIHQGDALKAEPAGRGFDLVVGNPPYGRVTLSPELRQKFNRSLFGHANLYGVFTDLALRLVKPRGVIGYVTPTSFLAGAYFKELRGLMGTQAPPISIDFITQRKRIFTDVMQETTLTVYQQGESPSLGEVRFTTLQLNGSTTTEQAGAFQRPEDPRQPWAIPRKPEQNDLVGQMACLPHRISDYGYEVNTGQLVWNRHKEYLRAHPGAGRYPLVWAESIRPNELFEFKAGNRNHRRYFMPQPNQAHFVTNTACILLQRTTAKEQDRRLVAAERQDLQHRTQVPPSIVQQSRRRLRPTRLPQPPEPQAVMLHTRRRGDGATTPPTPIKRFHYSEQDSRGSSAQ